MYNNYGYPPPDWFYWQQMMANQNRSRGNKRPRRTEPSPLQIIRQWEAYQEAKEKKKKDSDKNGKKPPSGNDAIFSFLQWWAVMSVFGLPIGLITLYFLNAAVKAVPILVLNAVK